MSHLRTFGGLSIETDHAAVATVASRRRPLALLALLAIAGERGISREKVVALLWPESDEEHGRNSLSQALAALRRDLAANEPIVGTTELRLNPSVITSDVGEFQVCIASGALERAAELYQGPFLDGFFVRDAAEFERWTEEQRRRLHDVCAGALERLAHAADQLGSHPVAVAWWKRLAALEPTSAKAVSGLMGALVTMGDHGGALRQYRVHEELMRQEFAAAPDPALCAFAATLLTNRAGTETSIASDGTSPRRDVARQNAVQPDVMMPASGLAVALTMVRGTEYTASRHRGLSRPVAGVGVLAAIAALVWVGIAAHRDHGTAFNADRRVVVRAFKNNSGDPAFDPIGLMAADWIARGLAQTPSVDVAGTESDMIARDPSLDPSTLGRLMHARYVISGSHYTQNDSLFVQAEVWDADAGRLVVPVPAVGDAIKAKTAVLERLRQKVTGALVTLFDSSIVTMSRVPPTYEAYQEFLAGDQLYDSDHPASIKHLQAAARLDPSFINARLRLISEFQVTLAKAQRDSLIAEVETRRAELSPYDAASFEFRVAIAKGDHHGAYLAADRARQLAPRSTRAAYEAGEAALLDNRPHEAIRLLETLDPQSGALRSTHAYYGILCRSYHDVDRMRSLRSCYERSRRQFPGFAMPWALGALADAKGVEQMFDSLLTLTGVIPHGALAGLYELDAHGHSDDARAIGRRALAHLRQPAEDSLAANKLLDPRVGLLAFLGEWRDLARVADSTPQARRSRLILSLRGMASAMLGDTADALRRAKTNAPGDSVLSAWDQTRILAALGDRQRTFAKVRTLGTPAWWTQYHGDVFFRFLRDYPPFQQFLKSGD